MNILVLPGGRKNVIKKPNNGRHNKYEREKNEKKIAGIVGQLADQSLPLPKISSSNPIKSTKIRCTVASASCTCVQEILKYR